MPSRIVLFRFWLFKPHFRSVEKSYTGYDIFNLATFFAFLGKIPILTVLMLKMDTQGGIYTTSAIAVHFIFKILVFHISAPFNLFPFKYITGFFPCQVQLAVIKHKFPHKQYVNFFIIRYLIFLNCMI